MVNEKENFVKRAEECINALKSRGSLPSTNQIRKILAMVNKIENQIQTKKMDENLDDELLAMIRYLEVKIVYQAGRKENKNVKKFVEETKLREEIKKIKTYSDWQNFYNYMEALVAFHKFYGGDE